MGVSMIWDYVVMTNIQFTARQFYELIAPLNPKVNPSSISPYSHFMTSSSQRKKLANFIVHLCPMSSSLVPFIATSHLNTSSTTLTSTRGIQSFDIL